MGRFLLFVVILSLFGCSKEKKTVPQPEAWLTLLYADQYFDAQGGYGQIEVSAGGSTIEAACNSGWVTPAVTDSIVMFFVGENISLSDRTSVITVVCGQESLQVQIHQTGTTILVDPLFLSFGPEGGLEFISIDSKTEYQIDTEAEWISYEKESGGIWLRASESVDKEIRMTPLKIEFRNGPRFIVLVKQEGSLTFDNLVGEWVMAASGKNGEPLANKIVNFSKRSSDGYYTLQGLDYDIFLRYVSGRLSIDTGQAVGLSQNGYIILCGYCRAYSIYDYSGSGLVADLEISEGKMIYRFTDDGRWGKFWNEGIGFREFAELPPQKEHDIGPVDGTGHYFDIVLSKL